MTKEQLFAICEANNQQAKLFVQRMKASGMSDADMQIAWREIFGIRMAATEDAEFHAEYSRDKAVFQKAGISQEDYIRSRRIDVGLESLPAATNEAKPPAAPCWLTSQLGEPIIA